MRIVIVGAGAIGSYLARKLATEEQDVVVVDRDPELTAELQESLDVLTITGNGASLESLRSAGADADLLIAVTNNDGANILACRNAHELGIGFTVGRVEDPELRVGVQELGVDLVIDPDESAAQEVLRLVRRTGLSDLAEFADGRLVLLGGRVHEGAALEGVRLAEARHEVQDWPWTVVAVVRGGETSIATGETVAHAGDRLLLMALTADADRAIDLIGIGRRPAITRTTVLGGNRLTSKAVDSLLDHGFEVVVVHADQPTCRRMAQRHGDALVVHGDPLDPDVLAEQGLAANDAVFALSSSDEYNVLACLVARALGAGMTVSHLHRVVHANLIAGVGVDATVSRRVAAANAILEYVRGSHVTTVVGVKGSDAEALEIKVDGDAPAVDRTLADLTLPAGAVIGGVLRDGEAFVPTGATTVRAGDYLFAFALPSAIAPLMRIFAR